jgi:phage terminase large subunit
LKLNKRIRGIAGGTSAGKTISILQILIDYAQSIDNQMISIVSESFPHLRRGAMRDFLNIMQAHGYYDDNEWSRTDFTYSFSNGSKMEFFSADQPGKVRGPRRDVLFVNEANNIDYESFDQLRIRTRKVIWLDWNPTNEFWWYTDIVPNYEHDFITLTYKDNEALDDSIILDIESHKHNKNWWRVYGLGQLGEVENRIYTDWVIIDDIPHEARLERRGMDFGYTNDPTAIIDVYKYNGGFILDERLYRKGMTNKMIADYINNGNDPDTLVIADSAEPKSIDELRLYGVNILPAQKGQGSILQGIQYVQDQRISMTKRSINLIKEYRNYLWQTDKINPEIYVNVPEPGNDHLLDALRYALEGYARSYGEVGIVDSSPEQTSNTVFVEDGQAKGLYNIGDAIRRNRDDY